MHNLLRLLSKTAKSNLKFDWFNSVLFLTDVSKVTLGSVLGLVALCVISVAIVFVVYKRKQRKGQEQEPSFENPLSREGPVSSDVEQQDSTQL